MVRAFVFPGQGSQAVGMGRELAEAFPSARHLLEEVDDALGQRLSRLMFEGPESDLTRDPRNPAVQAHVARAVESAALRDPAFARELAKIPRRGVTVRARAAAAAATSGSAEANGIPVTCEAQHEPDF